MQDQMIEDKFNAAVNVIRSLPKDGPYQPSHDMMLKFYGLYKQATEGPCTESKPSFYEVIKGYKWRAWTSLGNMTKTDAMKTYVEELKKIVETMAYSEDVATFIDALGPFYEYVEIPSNKIGDHAKKIINKQTKADSLDEETMNYEMVTICNGGDSPKINGTLDSCGENIVDQTDKSITSEIESTNVKIKKNLNREDMDINLDLQYVREDLVIVDAKNEKNHQNALDLGLNVEVESSSFENGIKSTYLYSLKKMTSDTESDEEYSEPAETPELLQQKQRQRGKDNANAGNDSRFNPVNLSHDNLEDEDDSPVLEIVTCGGGDASDAGRIRMVQAYQSQQGTYVSRGNRNSTANQTPTGNPPRSGESGRRRRRDSEEHSSNVNMDVNVQLVYILQKIHQDLEAVVLRLDSLERQAINQHQNVCALCRRRLGIPISNDNFWLWPFPELSARSTFFLLTWPLVIHGGVKFLRFLRSRRLRKMATMVQVKST